MNKKRDVNHGHARTKEYSAWSKMKDRCHNEKANDYKWYGAKGVIVCTRWRTSFLNFLDDMGSKPSVEYSLDRINGEFGYFKENCRWATPLEQALNKLPKENANGLSVGVGHGRNGRGPFVARMTVNKKTVHIGCYETEELARAAYCEAYKEWYGISPAPSNGKPEELIESKLFGVSDD